MKIRVLSMSKEHFAKTFDFHVRSAFGHVQVTLCNKRRKVMDFELEIALIRGKCRELKFFECDSLPGSVQNNTQKQSKNAKSSKIIENPRSVPFENA